MKAYVLSHVYEFLEWTIIFLVGQKENGIFLLHVRKLFIDDSRIWQSIYKKMYNAIYYKTLYQAWKIGKTLILIKYIMESSPWHLFKYATEIFIQERIVQPKGVEQLPASSCITIQMSSGNTHFLHQRASSDWAAWGPDT
jgi:hypothetical protein